MAFIVTRSHIRLIILSFIFLLPFFFTQDVKIISYSRSLYIRISNYLINQILIQTNLPLTQIMLAIFQFCMSPFSDFTTIEDFI